MTLMAEVRSAAWEAGNVAGADDCSIWLDIVEERRHNGYRANYRLVRTRNPYVPGTLDHADWGLGYERGWQEVRDQARERR